MRLLLAAALVVAPAAALAQSALEIKVNNAEEYVVGTDDCSLNIPITITVGTGVLSCKPLKLWFTSATSCPEEPSSTETPFYTDDDEFPTSQVINVPVSELPAFVGDGGTPCGATGTEKSYQVCGSFKVTSTFTGSCETVVEETSPPTVIYDGLPPAAPVLSGAEGLDKSIAVSVETDNDASTVTLTARNTQTDATTTKEVGAPITSRVVIEGLENGVEYELTATARDQAGNVSEPSAPITATPVTTSGFLQAYADAGGTETGGCTAAGFTTTGMFGMIVGLWLLARRRS